MLRPPPFLLAAVFLVLAAACAAPGAASGRVEIPAGGFDLSDPDLQTRLGSPELPDIVWQRQAGELTVVGRSLVADPDEIALIEAVASDVPQVIWKTAPVRHIVRMPDAPGTRPAHEKPVAFALGPDVYLLDRAFELSEGGSSRYDLARAFIHELVHVAQFFTMSDEYVARSLSGAVETVDPTVGSSLVQDFAEATGWRTVADGDWELADTIPAASTYGRTSPGEDMAESVTLVAVGLADLLPPDRVRWVEGWLGVSADELSRGRPWVPPGSEEVLSVDALYDESQVAQLARSRRRVEPLYFQLPVDAVAAPEMATALTSELLTRGMSGSLQPASDSPVPRYSGAFAGTEGITWWVELWDFRFRPPGTSGPDRPILIYVAVW